MYSAPAQETKFNTLVNRLNSKTPGKLTEIELRTFEKEVADVVRANWTLGTLLKGAVAAFRSDIEAINKWYRQILDQDPQYLIGLANYAVSLAKAGAFHQSLEQAIVVWSAPGGRQLHKFAMVLMEVGMPAGKFIWLDEHISKDENDVDVHAVMIVRDVAEYMRDHAISEDALSRATQIMENVLLEQNCFAPVMKVALIPAEDGEHLWMKYGVDKLVADVVKMNQAFADRVVMADIPDSVLSRVTLAVSRVEK